MPYFNNIDNPKFIAILIFLAVIYFYILFKIFK
jgi:hypothetical protein